MARVHAVRGGRGCLGPAPRTRDGRPLAGRRWPFADGSDHPEEAVTGFEPV